MAANTSSSVIAPSLSSSQSDHPSSSFSVSVGRDNWAGEVIDNVVGASDQSQGDQQPHVNEQQLDSVQAKTLEKKRIFHKNRFLELKNLPEGVTEQVTEIVLCKMVKSSVHLSNGCLNFSGDVMAYHILMNDITWNIKFNSAE